MSRMGRVLQAGGAAHPSSPREVAQMRLWVYKPVKGQVRIMLDDLRGVTGRRDHAKGVAIEDVPEVVGVLVDDWAKRRKSIYDAKKGKSA